MMALADWRDVALILLLLEASVLTLAVGTALYFSLRGLRRFQVWLKPYLLLARTYTRQAHDTIIRITAAVIAPFVWLHSLLAGLRRALDIVGGR
jgi:hypothetical protein